jgi:phosphopantothenoylcysteine decarboxylase/phosphopantothenate--cysteine ligase
MSKSKNILLAVTGGIAAYKAIDLASRLVKEGYNINVLMTDNAQHFVNPLSFSSMIDKPVVTELFNQESPIEHITLADWADLTVIAPATANIIGKIASGIADDLLSTTVMATTTPVLLIPAMNTNMYTNPIVQSNLKKLHNFGYKILPPASGRLACGTYGEGRYPDNEEILFAIKSFLTHQQRDLEGKKVLVTLGSCREYLDPMRYISNVSSGKMGLAIARSAYFRGAEVTVVAGKITEKLPHYLNAVEVTTSAERAEQVCKNSDSMDIIVMNAAVTDFQPIQEERDKIKKDSLSDTIELAFKPTTDILKELGNRKKKDQILIGFAAETQNIEENARKKLVGKKADMIVANHINTAGQNNTEMLLVTTNKAEPVSGSKLDAAHKMWDFIGTNKL